MPKKKQGFEDSISRLTEIVGGIESGDTTLEGAIALYKEGLALAQNCGDILGDYQSQVQRLKKEAEETFTMTPFE